jgi:dTMP kinase
MTNQPKFGRFITLEGIEGVGKSTLQKFVCDYLEAAGISVVVTREPGGTPIAEEIRKVLLSHHAETITPDTELLLLFAGRAQHIAQVIRPALLKGQWVICDRFTDTTYAYQGNGRGISMEKIATLEKWIQGDLRPDPVLLFDAPVDIAFKRTRGRGKPDRIEGEQVGFFQRAREGFLARAKQSPNRYHIIDASAPLAQVKQEVKKILDQLLGNPS